MAVSHMLLVEGSARIPAGALARCTQSDGPSPSAAEGGQANSGQCGTQIITPIVVSLLYDIRVKTTKTPENAGRAHRNLLK
jgi:hypothetical protein